MRGLFSYDNGLFRALDKLGSLFVLNLLTILCALPLFTAGASFTALCYVTMKMVRDEETYVARDFFRSFRQNFRQATVLWLIIATFGAVLFFDYRIMSSLAGETAVAKAFMVLTMAVAVFYFVEVAYVFPVLAKFYNTIRQTMKNAMLMGISHFPQTVAILIIDMICPVAMLAAFYTDRIGVAVPLYACFGFAAPVYASSFVFVKIFDRYITTEEEQDGKEKEHQQ